MRTGMYGPDWTFGVLAGHLRGETVVLRDGEVVVLDGTEVVPVLCGELVEFNTEDGRVTGRCGAPVETVDGFACPGHTGQVESWLAQSEAETIEWERRIERERS